MSKRVQDILNPFKVALTGVAVTFRTQRHMRFHVYTVVFVTVLALFLNFALRELIILLFTVSLVLIAEMFNSAIETTVDLVEQNYNPLAKAAKDIAAGAVLITTIIALIIGGVLILGETRWESIRANFASEGLGPTGMVRIAAGFLVILMVVVIGKGLGRRGQVLKGGLVSGHAAYSFFLAIAIMALTDQWLASALAILLAAIVAQSRWEAKIHSIYELTLGAGVGTIVGLLLFYFVPK